MPFKNELPAICFTQFSNNKLWSLTCPWADFPPSKEDDLLYQPAHSKTVERVIAANCLPEVCRPERVPTSYFVLFRKSGCCHLAEHWRDEERHAGTSESFVLPLALTRLRNFRLRGLSHYSAPEHSIRGARSDLHSRSF